MSCLGVNYNPNPPNVWSRVRTTCDITDQDNMQMKANVLRYKNNSSNLTKQQRYAQIAKGYSTYKKTWATQTQTYTNPNLGIPISCPATIKYKPSTNSDVPGPTVMLRSYDLDSTYYPRRRLFMSSNGNAFPKNYKFV